VFRHSLAGISCRLPLYAFVEGRRYARSVLPPRAVSLAATSAGLTPAAGDARVGRANTSKCRGSCLPNASSSGHSMGHENHGSTRRRRVYALMFRHDRVPGSRVAGPAKAPYRNVSLEPRRGEACLARIVREGRGRGRGKPRPLRENRAERCATPHSRLDGGSLHAWMRTRTRRTRSLAQTRSCRIPNPHQVSS
jgi:hypothetical protein